VDRLKTKTHPLHGLDPFVSAVLVVLLGHALGHELVAVVVPVVYLLHYFAAVRYGQLDFLF